MSDLIERLRDAWRDFCEANFDGLTSPDEYPDHALITADQFAEYASAVCVDRIAELEASVEALTIERNFYRSGEEGLYPRIAELEAENARLREAHWFYLGDDCSSDACRFGIDECISEDFEWDNAARGDHVLQISGARPVPDMWVALHYYTDAEKDARDDDESYIYTVHATEEAARAALKEQER